MRLHRVKNGKKNPPEQLLSHPQFSAPPKESLPLAEYVDVLGEFGVQEVLEHAVVPFNFRACFHLVLF